jgi:hypothetical protein
MVYATTDINDNRHGSPIFLQMPVSRHEMLGMPVDIKRPVSIGEDDQLLDAALQADLSLPHCGLVMDLDDNSVVSYYQRIVARLEPHTDDPMRCAGVIAAIKHV